MNSLWGLVVLVVKTGVDDGHGATKGIGTAEVTLTDAHLLNELRVLLVQLRIGELDELVDTLHNAPLEGVEEHLHGIIQVPLAGTNELEGME
jgi:hypothetical protein